MFDTYLFTIIIILVVILASAIRVLREYERGVIFRLGRLIGMKCPGLILLIPIIDKMVRVSLYFRVLDANKAIVEVEDYLYATSQLAQTTLRAVLGQAELDELLTERDKINAELQRIVDEHTDPWGIKVSLVEVKHVDLPQDMQRAIARQAEAERERRAKIIHAEGELQASGKLSEAAAVLQKQPAAIQLSNLQPPTEISTEKSSTVILPIPIDLLKTLIDRFPSESKQTE